MYLASALFQRARYQKLTQDARNGPEFIVQVYDTCARMVLLVEDQLRHGSNGPVQVNALPAEPAEGDKTDGKP